jgi:hypothetical protein
MNLSEISLEESRRSLAVCFSAFGCVAFIVVFPFFCFVIFP